MLDTSKSMNLLVDVVIPSGHGTVIEKDGVGMVFFSDAYREQNKHLFEGKRTRLQICKDCLLEQLLPQRLAAVDRVGLVAFSTSVESASTLQPWTGVHKQNLQRVLRSLHPSGEQTNLWSAMHHAAEQLITGDTSRDKWLIALTDGASDDSPDRFAALQQRAAAEDINLHILFVTIEVRPHDERPIRAIVKPGNGTQIFPATATASKMEEAWAKVGEALTVSQQIEKLGVDLNEGECRQLLYKHMKLDSRSWSMLKQTHWVRYLYRRCNILRESDKFNKNTKFKQFGSTTMRIMLSEVEHALSDDYRTNWHEINHRQLVYWDDTVAHPGGKPKRDFKWSLLATNRDRMEKSELDMLKSLQMHVPTPEDLDREDRRVLDSYLAYGIGVPLSDPRVEKPFDMEIGSLPEIDQENFVLTLDFVMKMLCINERIMCRVPCIVEGETGVSKTALTRMLFILKNSPTRALPPKEIANEKIALSQIGIIAREKIYEATIEGRRAPNKITLACGILRDLIGLTERPGDDDASTAASDSDRIQNDLVDAAGCPDLEPDFNTIIPTEESFFSGEHEASKELAHDLARRACNASPRLAQELLYELRSDPGLDVDPKLVQAVLESDSEAVAKLLYWYVKTRVSPTKALLEWTFYVINVDAALTPGQIEEHLSPVVERAERLLQLAELLYSGTETVNLHRSATICIFLDEINTSSFMGVFKELVVDHRLSGRDLPNNITVVAACNPARDRLVMSDARRLELGNEWAIGHYQVRPVPGSMQQVMWDYGSLTPAHEREFIEKRMHQIRLSEGLLPCEEKRLVKLLHTAQTATREFAKRHIEALMSRSGTADYLSARNDKDTVDNRASSSVSLRDILRVFKLFHFFRARTTEKDDKMSSMFKKGISDIFLQGCEDPIGNQEKEKRRERAMLLSLAVVYYLRLGAGPDEDFRTQFTRKLSNRLGSKERADVSGALTNSMKRLMENVQLEVADAT